VYGRGLKVNQGTLTLTFPSGAQLAFRHLQHEKNIYDWQGAQLSWVGFDEATHFSWKQVSYLISRLRTTSGLPTKVRLTCNPDAESWLAQFLAWWVDQATGYAIPERAGKCRWMYVVSDLPQFFPTRPAAEAAHPKLAAEDRPLSVSFVPSSLDDTPQLAGTGYKGRLLAQTEVERERLLKGNWKITAADGMFKPHWFKAVEALPAGLKPGVRFWDLAATEETVGADPDYTVGVHMLTDGDGRFYVANIRRDRLSPLKVKEMVVAAAGWDGRAVAVAVEQEGGSGGKYQADDLVRALAGYTAKAVRPVGKKEERAAPYAAQAEAGNVYLLRAPWNTEFVNEHSRFPIGAHDDIVDAASGAFAYLTTGRQLTAADGKAQGWL
jgi:predicted phage terminase large subunit-like protein